MAQTKMVLGGISSTTHNLVQGQGKGMGVKKFVMWSADCMHMLVQEFSASAHSNNNNKQTNKQKHEIMDYSPFGKS